MSQCTICSGTPVKWIPVFGILLFGAKEISCIFVFCQIPDNHFCHDEQAFARFLKVVRNESRIQEANPGIRKKQETVRTLFFFANEFRCQLFYIVLYWQTLFNAIGSSCNNFEELFMYQLSIEYVFLNRKAHTLFCDQTTFVISSNGRRNCCSRLRLDLSVAFVEDSVARVVDYFGSNSY